MRHLILHRSGIRRLTALVAATALSASIVMSAGAITQSDIDATQSKIQEMQSQQKEYESQQADIQSQLDDLAEQENSAVNELLLYQEQAENLEAQIDNTNAIIADYDTQIADTQALIDEYTTQIAQTEEELAAAQEEEAQYYELYCDRVRSMEEDGNTSYWSIILNATSFSDLLDRITFINEVMDYDNDVMDKLEAARQKVADTKARLEEEKAAQEEAKAQLETEKAAQEEALAQLEDQQAQVQAAYDQISATLAEIQANEEAYADQMSQLESLTADLEEDILQNQELYENQVAALQKQIEEAAEKKRQEEAAAKAAAEAAAKAAAASSSSNSSSSSSSDSSSSSSSTSSSSSSSSSSALGAQIATYACQFIGNPYVWGGTSLTNGADCSGFVMSVYAHFGYSLPHSSLSMRSLGTGVSYANAQPGDLVCYYSSGSPTGGHVGIYIGDGMMVNAASSKLGIIISTVNTSRSGITFRRII